jgi:hypothetical protein
LAGETCCDDICFAFDKASRRNVLVDFNARPVFSEDSSAERINLAEGDGSHSGPFKAKTETADSREEIEDIHVRLQ